MRFQDINLTSFIFGCFIVLEFLPIAFSCIYLLNGWMPMSVYNRTSKADIVLSAQVIRTFKAKEFRTEVQTYTATVKIIDVYKGHRLLRTVPVNRTDPYIYNVTNFGDRKMCYADIMEGKNYLLFLTTYKQRLSAKYDDIFGAATKFTEYNIQEVMDQIGSGFEMWSGWSSCSKSCDRGEQVRKRACKTGSTQCESTGMDKRDCNTFSCTGVHDLLDYLGVYKLPLGVYHVHERPGAFNVTGSAKLYSLFSNIYNSNLPQQYSLIMSVNFHRNFSGYFFTLSDLMGKQKIAIKYSRGKTKDSITFEFYDNQGYPGKRSPVFDIRQLENTWHQFAIAINGNTVDLYVDCETVLTQDLGRIDFTTIGSNLMLSLGPYYARYGGTFEGEIEQLVITDSASSAAYQCSSDLVDRDRAIKDEGDNGNEESLNETGEVQQPNKTTSTNKPPITTVIAQPLQVTDMVAEWTEWSACTRTCGRGVQVRTLYCGNNIISNCVHAGMESEQIRWCNRRPCNVGCQPSCENGATCSAGGMCLCTSGYIGHTCSIALCSPDCMNGGRCSAPGQCTCPMGYTGRYCENAICSPECANGGRCIQPGYCSCPYGYMPPSCEPICLLPCRNGGRCVRHDKCKCPKGYKGRDCSQPICRRGCFNGGRCVAPNTCTCPRGYGGSRCHKPICYPACQNKGRCLYPGICHCKRGYSGNNCEKAVCKKPCQNGGYCTGNNTCACPQGYRGRYCHKVIRVTKCKNRCFNGGRCRKRRCRCKAGFTGVRCEKRVCKYETFLMPYTQTYRKLERKDVATLCGPWKWKTCVETRIQYVTSTRTMYRTAYRCV